MITSLPALIAALPEHERQVANQIYVVDCATATLEIPTPLEDWATRRFGDLTALRRQTVVRVLNRLTLEGACFNPLRARRPHDDAGGDADLDHTIAQARHQDIFADPPNTTTREPFGRIRGRYCTTAANIACYDGLHGVVVFDEFHPLRFDGAHLADYLATAGHWLQRAHAYDPQAIFPLITWNCLWKAGASLVHGHMQITLSRTFPHAAVARWQAAAKQYRDLTSRTYLADIHRIAVALGLACGDPHVDVFASLTPVKERELVMVPATPDPAALAPTLDRLLRRLIDVHGMRAFNLALALPPLDQRPWPLPAYARLVDRGRPLTRMSDMGAMELFGASVVLADPFDVAASLR